MKIGILREGKVPIDKRVALTPQHASALQQTFSCTVVAQPSPIRAIGDAEYVAAGIELQEDLSDCDVLFGVKEVPLISSSPTRRTFSSRTRIKSSPTTPNY
jgi:saccharopine dehydrogenase (NAD+, L-lysine-forming)